MNDAIEELIKEIAVKHNIAVSRDDPMMILHTINQRLMQDSAKAHEEQLTKHKKELESMSMRWENSAKAIAERILNASLVASKESMRKSADTMTTSFTQSVKEVMTSAWATANKSHSYTYKVVVFNLIAASLALIASIVAVSVMLYSH